MGKKVLFLMSSLVVLTSTASGALVAHWPFNNSPNDQVGALHWTLNGGATYSTECKEGSASLLCDGQDDYAGLAGSGLMSAAFPAKTVMLWFKPNTTTGAQTIFDEGGQNQGIGIRINNGLLEASVRASNVAATLSTPLANTDWAHVAISYAAGPFKLYFNGVEVGSATAAFASVPSHTGAAGLGARNGGNVFGTITTTGDYYGGLIDDVRIYDNAVPAAEIQDICRNKALAVNVSPTDGATDVPNDTVLNWTAGEYAATHDVYLGTKSEDVESASRTDLKGILPSQGQTATSYDPAGLLAYGQTYYWRIDEVNKTPDNTIFKGKVWSFTIEPYAYPIKPMAATASSSQAGMGPEKTIDGSGLAGDLHGTGDTTMWLSGGVSPNWIQYEFDKVYKLHQLLVWNSNQMVESFLGFGAKQVTIETSSDGTTWATVANVPEFAKAPGTAGYAANTTVSLGGAQAKYVKLTINASWGGMATTGLSEVRFSYVPVQARVPQPATAATGVSVDTALEWRPGRAAASHKVYFGTDPNAVAQGTAPAQTVTEQSFTPGALNLGITYYWRVDEVNAATYPGEVWSFTTQDYKVVDDFESYTDKAGEEIFSTWIDGFADNYKSSGSTVGLSTAVKGTFGETTIIHGGKQSMPLAYDNTMGPGFSEATWTFDSAQDWTANGIRSLSLWFQGAAGNGGQLYAKINGTKILYDGEAADVARPAWQAWNIDLSKAVKVNSVRSLTIGIEGAGAKGTLYVDDIRLYPKTPEYITPVQPAKGPVAYYPMDGDYKDASGNSRHGTAAGGPSFGAGQTGQAVSFDGTGDYVTINNWQGILGGNPFTISLWVKSTALDDRTIVCWGGATNGTRVDFRLYQGRLRMEHGNGNIQASTVLADDQWHHAAVVVTQGAALQYPQVALYVDGRDDTQATADPDVFGSVADVPVTIGQRRTNNDRDFQGMLDEVRIFDVALRAEEVAALAGCKIPLHRPF